MLGADFGIIVGIIICVMFSAFFSASETAFTTLNRIRLKTESEAGDSRAALVLSIAENYDKMLSTILIGNNIVNIASASLATIVFTHVLGDAGVSVSTAVMTVIVLIFGEISPKNLAKEHPEAFARFSAPFLRLLITILTPINFIFSQWKKLLNKIFKKKSDNRMTQEELKTIVDEAQSEGGIDEEKGELIRSAIEFDDLTADDILTPRVDIVGIDEECPFQEISDIFLKNTYSRLPVYSDSIDNIIGIVHEKDYFSAQKSGISDIKQVMKKVLYISRTVKISDLLRTLQKTKSHMAIVVDEFGGTEGLVTMEDIIEELVGDIWDEHDVVIDYFNQIDDHTYVINCSADLHDLFEEFDLGDSDEFESASVGGWAMELLGKIPSVGDTFDFKGWHITVTKATSHHATQLTMVSPEEGARDE
ncbi:HlyC/CorC family transporter [Anaeromassilibacillus sp. An250]|uniref:HlyC/CorC family transporter n=1 Tax=Anaeromassilibacillus sp. An250 TaxID=1965604 RepID=UPI000B367361|nr:hemolysin family protein [Anaeromassilibacillus sp. An250]OUO72742.1 transporter [Anaeromassilibacillus sp. An250]